MKHTGLTREQVEESRRLHGTNALTELPPVPLWIRLLRGFTAPLIVILLVAWLVQLLLFCFGLAHWYEPFGVFVAILIANGVAALFEHKQEGKATALRHEVNAKERAKALRDSELSEIPLDEVVVGDLIFLQAGDKIPADGVLVEGNLKVDQAALNGESEEASKRALDKDATYNTRDLLNPYTIYRGTVVCSGEAYQQIQVVGDQTELGQAALAAQEKRRETPLQLKLGRLANQISMIGYFGAVLIVAAVLLTTICTGKSPEGWSGWLRLVIDAVTVAVTIIVCAVPEGLPMLSSLLQAIQSLKMVKDNVLVRKIHGLETAGSLSLLFCDKTGTITEGRLSVVELATGKLESFSDLSHLSENLREALLIGIGANNSSLLGADGVLGGNATDRALLSFLVANGAANSIDRDLIIASHPFDSNKKLSSIVVKRNGAIQTYLKGAPEKIIERCVSCIASDGSIQPLEEKARLNDYLNAQATRSMRLLAVAMSEGDREDAPLVLVCVISIRDNVRREVRDAVREIQNAGIQVVMITGDRKETAIAIAKEAGLLASSDDVAMTSFELAEKSDDELKELLPRLRVVARALPLDKSRLVRIAQELDLVVGMTGDGVNDSPALRKADVGFAMGSGTEVAKEAGDITILDDNLSSIEKAILYGRTMFKSIRKFLVFQLTVNVAAVVTCSIAPLLGQNVVLTVIQLLLINLAMDTLAAIAYGSEPPLKEYMEERPIPRSQGLVTGEMLTTVMVSACTIALVCLSMLFLPWMQRFIGAVATDGVVNEIYLKSALFATFMMAITCNGFNARTSHLNPFEGIGRNPAFLVVMGLLFLSQFVFVTFGGKPLAVTPLTISTWLKCLALALLVFPIDFLRKKRVLRRLFRR